MTRKDLQPYLDRQHRKARVVPEDVQRLRHLENRAQIVRMRSKEGKTIREISDETGLTKKRIEWYLDWALQRTLTIPESERIMAPRPRLPKRVKTIVATPMAASSVSTAPTVPAPTSVPAVLSPSDDPEIQAAAFRMRTNMVPLAEIADSLGISKDEASRAVRAYSDMLSSAEINDTEVARRIQVEQIDLAIRAILPSVTGIDVTGVTSKKGVIFEAVDRFVKLLDAKAKLLGLNAPTKIDMDIRLQKIAETGEYDIETLRSIFEEVVSEYPQLTAGV